MKMRCSLWCTTSLRKAPSYTAGKCQPEKNKLNTAAATTGRVNVRAGGRTARPSSSGRKTHSGRPTIRRGATA